MARSILPSVIPKPAQSQTLIMPVGALSVLFAANPAMARMDARSVFRRAVGVSDTVANGVTAADKEFPEALKSMRSVHRRADVAERVEHPKVQVSEVTASATISSRCFSSAPQ